MMTALIPDDLGRDMSQPEKTACVHYLSSVARGNTGLDAAQHALAQMPRADVRPDFVAWLSKHRLRISPKGRVTRHPPGTATKPNPRWAESDR